MRRFFYKLKSALSSIFKQKQNNTEDKKQVVKKPVENVDEIDRPNLDEENKKLMFYPLGSVASKMNTKGKFANSYPRGVVVHFTAGRSLKGDQEALDTVSWGRGEGYSFWVISRTGRIYMTHALSEWGSHAGKSSWKGFSNISQYCLGIEIACAGKLEKRGEKFFSWFGEEIPPNEVRLVDDKHGGGSGFYHRYTVEQELALMDLILWLKKNNPDVFEFDWVVGHHEISPNRKNDPGGSLSIPMHEFRSVLKKSYLDRLNK
jgi:N-acetyl-anhydromuramyl-L-alanine amidase AmpD